MKKATNQIEIYKSKDNKIELSVAFNQDSVWLSQKQIGVFFKRDYKTISKHIINIFKEQELNKKSVVANFAITDYNLSFIDCSQ